jgi:hypothetical protein
MIAGNMKFIRLLVHSWDWALDERCFHLAKGISIVRLPDFGAHTIGFLIDSELLSEYFHPYNFAHPYSITGLLMTFLTIISGTPQIGINVNESNDMNFDERHSTGVYFYDETNDVFHNQDRLPEAEGGGRVFDVKALQQLRTFWDITSPYVESRAFGGSRLDAILVSFHAAWTAKILEHSVLFQSIVFELLFSPESSGETTHQISFNTAKYVGKTPEGREEIYKLMKRFYAVRSQIVHGTKTRVNSKDITCVLNAFRVLVDILTVLFSNPEFIETLNNKAKRNALLQSFMFE